jgi:hypothetical protein
MMATLEALVDRVREQAADQAEQALRGAVRSLRQGGQDLGEIERHARQDILPIGAGILQEALRTMGNGKTTSHRRCACGGVLRYVSDRSKSLQTLLGAVSVERAYYHCRQCGKGDFPLDQALGVVDTSLTPGVREAVAWADAAFAYGRAAEFLERMVGLTLSKETHETVSGQLGQAVQPQETERARRAWESLPGAEQFYVTLDGVKVNTHEGWKEPKLGAVFRAHATEDGEPIRGPTRYVGHLEEAEDFGERLWRLADASGIEKAKTVIVVGDGAPWIWNLADFHFPQAVQIVDFFHALEKLSELARSHWPEGASAAKAWMESCKTALREGRVGRILRALKTLPAKRRDIKELVRKALAYFHQNRHRMRYDQFRAKGYFIGSGVIEAGCKSVIAQRFKQSGMRWSRPGFLKLLHLRLCIVNGEWDDFARAHFPRLTNLQATYF